MTQKTSQTDIFKRAISNVTRAMSRCDEIAKVEDFCVIEEKIIDFTGQE